MDDEDFSDGEGRASKQQNGVSNGKRRHSSESDEERNIVSRYPLRRSRQTLPDEDDFNGENQQEKASGQENAAPPPKRIHISESEEEEMGEEDTGPRYPFRQNRARVIRLEEQMTSLNGKRRRHGRRSVHFGRGSSHRQHSLRRRRRNSSYSSESSSTSDSDIADAEKDYRAELKFEKRKLRSLQKGRSRFLPLNVSQKEWDETQKLNRLTSKHNEVQATGDIEPMGIDKSVSFENIGGLDEHIQSLKESVVFPLLYPELFENFKIAPPKGVLFYGKHLIDF